jgi:hypothetical protein
MKSTPLILSVALACGLAAACASKKESRPPILEECGTGAQGCGTGSGGGGGAADGGDGGEDASDGAVDASDAGAVGDVFGPPPQDSGFFGD